MSPKTLKKIVKVSKYVFYGLVILTIIFMLIDNNVSFASTSDVGDSVYNWVSDSWFNTMNSIVLTLAVFLIIIAGIVYLFDLGGGKQIGLAKEMIVAVISGLLLYFLAAGLLRELSDIFHIDPPVVENGGDTGGGGMDTGGGTGDGGTESPSPAPPSPPPSPFPPSPPSSPSPPTPPVI